MSEQAYLTIGEVLGLLVEEFPDVTVSKIRFLESQGLVEPERTPSGYRKFSDRDVERLRYVMREQRNHYLPLRVIKDRLNESDLTSPGGPRPVPGGAAWATVEGGSEAVQEVVRKASQLTGTPVEPPPVDVVESDPAAPEGLRLAQRAPVERGDWSLEDSTLARVDGVPRAAAHKRVEPSESTSAQSEPVEQPRPPAPQPSPMPTAAPESSPMPTAAPSPVEPSRRPLDTSIINGLQELPAEAKPPVVTAVRPPVEPAVVVHPEPPTELSKIALMAATGATERLVDDLESFGLLIPRGSGPAKVYGGESIELVRIAKSFAERGIEVRHLRTWRMNADKEIGLFEQLVVPLVRQRNPQSRDQAAQMVTELTRLGADLRRHLMTAGLRQYLER